MSTHKPPDDPVLFAFFNEIGIINQLSQTLFTRVLPDGLQVSHFAMLNHMVRLGDGWTPLRLAKAFQVTKGAITNTINRLETRGLVRTEPDAHDRRSKRVFITPRGREVREACIGALLPQLAQLQQDMGEEIFADALPALREIRTYLDSARD